MRHPRGVPRAPAWALLAAPLWNARTVAGDGGESSDPGGRTADASIATASSSLPTEAGGAAASRQPPCNTSAGEGLLLELQAERAGLRRRGIMGDQAMLDLTGMVAICLIAAGGVYRYRQRRPASPSPQVLGRLLEDHELSGVGEQ
mmetsp:Transcript_44961/g.101144  ORF Transcript_44961/g.101144 Transcript_44961/m.101144 type:complete len:146 (+) Transcript_44961:131-568(+)